MMRLRSFAALAILLVLAIAVAACGDEDGTAGGTTGSTGATGATGSTELGKFTTGVHDAEGDNLLSFSGISCDGLNGPFVVTIAVQGTLSGETTATLELVDGAGTLTWSMDVTGAQEGTLSGVYDAELSPIQDTGILVFSGVTKVETADGIRTFDVDTGDVSVDVGTGVCPNP
jgi:hypothetical protein